MDDHGSDKLYQSLINAGLRFVSYRPRSRKEFVEFFGKKLAKWKKENPRVLSKVLVRFEDLGYINDSAFALWWVTQRSQFRPKGYMLIARELLVKGIDREIIEQARMNFLDTEKELAKKVVQKKFVHLAGLPHRQKLQKLYGYLGRRGFSADTIARVVDDILGHDV